MENQKPIYKECSQGHKRDKNDPMAFTGMGYEKVTKEKGHLTTVFYYYDYCFHNEFGPAVIKKYSSTDFVQKHWYLCGFNVYIIIDDILKGATILNAPFILKDILKYLVQMQAAEICTIETITKLKILSAKA